MRTLLIAALALVVSPVIAQEHSGDAPTAQIDGKSKQPGITGALRTADDWYECAAFLYYDRDVAMAEGDWDRLERLTEMESAAARTKGDKLASGSDELPSDIYMILDGEPRTEGQQRVAYFRERHRALSKNSSHQERAAFRKKYAERCTKPVAELVARIGEQGGMIYFGRPE